MAKITFLHVADVHLDSPFKGMEGQVPPFVLERLKESTFRAFRRVIDAAIRENVDFVLLAGDIYDQETSSLAAQLFIYEQMNRLQEHDIYVYIIHGNHDHVGSRRAALTFPDHVHIFTDAVVQHQPFYKNDTLLAYIYGFSYPERAVTANMTAQYNRAGEAPFHIGMLHGSLEGESGHSRYAPFQLGQLLEKEFHYWALGHIHKRAVLYEQPPVVYPGNIQGRHRKETGEKGCYLVVLEEGQPAQYHFIPAADVVWTEAAVSIDGLMTVHELLSACRTAMEQQRRTEEAVLLVLTFSGTGPLAALLGDYEQREDLLLQLQPSMPEQNFVHIARVYNETIVPEALAAWKTHPFLRELAAEAQRIAVPDVMRPVRSTPAARALIELPSPEEEAEIIKEAEQLLRQLLAGGQHDAV